MVPNLGATPLAQNGISAPAQRDELGAVLSFSGALFDAPDRGHLVRGRDVPVGDLDLVANALEFPVAFDGGFIGGDVAAAHKEPFTDDSYVRAASVATCPAMALTNALRLVRLDISS